MQAATACELPHSLDRIEFGTIRGEEIQGKTVGVLFPPRLVESRVVIRGIVGNDHNPSPGPTTDWAELLEKLKEARPIEFAGLPTEHKTPIPQAHCPEIPHTLAGWGMQ